MAHKTRTSRKSRTSRKPARRYLKRHAARGTRKALAKRRRATRRLTHRRPRRQLAGSRQVLNPYDARVKHAKLSLRKAVEAAGVSKATICRIELGRPAKHSNLVALEQAYGLPAGSFDSCPRS